MLVKLDRNRHHTVYKTSSGLQVPGASTIAKIGFSSDALIAWAHRMGVEGKDFRKVKEEAADIGTLAHFKIECYLRGNIADLSNFSADQIAKANTTFQKFEDWWNTEELTIIEPETILVSDSHLYGGTIDAPCTDRHGRMVLLDWKTSKAVWDEYLCQLAGYEALWNECRPSQKIERRAIIRIGKEEEGDFEVRWLGSTEREFEVFKKQAALYHEMKKWRKR